MSPNEKTSLPPDHGERMQRVLLSLDGLSVGDSFGENFFSVPGPTGMRPIRRPPAPQGSWYYTDDTAMAISIVRCLTRLGRIDQDALAAAFGQEYARDPQRGYGGMAQIILQLIGSGVSWKEAARQAFGGEGSCGNGGAMRSAPIGAYFADDYQRVIREAKASAEVTHAHPDGKTGAAAVALAAAWMVREYDASSPVGYSMIEFVLEHLPQTDTYHQLMKALDVPLRTPPQTAVRTLGNGSRVISWDTVPFCLWCASRHADNFEQALWTTVSGLGDCDTNAAIVGGIVALSAGRESIPADWLEAREPVQI